LHSVDFSATAIIHLLLSPAFVDVCRPADAFQLMLAAALSTARRLYQGMKGNWLHAASFYRLSAKQDGAAAENGSGIYLERGLGAEQNLSTGCRIRSARRHAGRYGRREQS
jgi:hypothetical protein